MRYADIFEECEQLLAQRGKGYGDAHRLHKAIAGRMTSVIGVDRLSGSPLSAYEAARLLAELKGARLDVDYSEDSLLDQINYLVIALSIKRAEVSQGQANEV